MKKFLAIMVCITALILSTGCGGGGSNKKLVCKSPEGSITITYNDDTLIGYTASGITFDLDGQREVSDILGTDGYADSFTDWFTSNTSGDCEKK